jgi:hypothetical protein
LLSCSQQWLPKQREIKMGKVYVAKLEFEYIVDENNYLDWEDEYEIEDEDKDESFEPRTLGELLSLLKDEFADTLLQIEIRDCVSIEERETNV